MPSPSDHVRRDAQHAARSYIRMHAARYVRRWDSGAYADIDESLAVAEQTGEAIDGLELGRLAAIRALAAYGVIDASSGAQALDSGPAAEAEADSA